jgi:hypothetical protein
LDLNPYKKVEENVIIRTYFQIFDRIFFFGALKGLVRVAFAPPEEMGFSLGRCATRYLNSRALIPVNFAASIEIIDFSQYEEVNLRNTKRDFYLGVLLHEMLHAYIAIYLCTCNEGCNALYGAAMGRSGHGDLWIDAAFAIEQATGPLLGMRLDLGREGGLKSEYGPDYRRTAPPAVLSTLILPLNPFSSLGAVTIEQNTTGVLRN